MTGTAEMSKRGAWIAVIVFTLVYTLHSVDRYVIAVVLEPIRHEFDLTDTQLGALGGIAHALAYSLFVLPVGWLLDRTNRVRLLTLALAVWSGITLLGAFVTGYWQLFALRMGVGAAESATSPSVQSLTASLFDAKMRASALGVIFSGIAIGTGLIFAVGGIVAENFGWRSVFWVAGLPGLVVAVFMWFYIKEPPRRTAAGQKEPPPPLLHAIRFAVGSRAILFSALGLTFASMCVGSVWTWITPILVRQQGFSLVEAGLIVGTSAGVVKFVSTIGSGFLSDRVAKGRIDRLWIVPSILLLISLPAGIGLTYLHNDWLVIAATMVLGFTLGSHYAAPRAIIVSVTPERMRGSVTSVEQLMVNLFGAGMGPLITGAISDYLGGENSVGLALIATLFLNIVAAVCFWIAALGAKDVDQEAAAAALAH